MKTSGVLSCLLGALLCACESTPTTSGDAQPLDPPQPYAELATAYNRRVAPIRRVWSRAVVEIEWTDGDGKKHLEQGEGPMIVRKPGELALAIGKLGVTRFWLGCGQDRYWFFDLADDKRVAYVGKQDRAVLSRTRALPIPMRPDRLIRLAGITALPVFDDPSVVHVERTAEGHRITLPADRELGGLRTQVNIDGQSRATRVRLMTARGELLVDASLARFEPMRIEGQPPGAWPDVARRIEVMLPRHQAKIDLFIEQLTDSEDKVKDVQFDFDRLTKALKVDAIEDVDAIGASR